ncbi:MAG: phosphotransferase, partial [Chloroflexota bacterium]|nr:phosphotransferase [Chloroflexota bacterium]
MRRELNLSIEELLASETLTRIAGQPVESVREAPLEEQSAAWSGSALTVVEVSLVGGESRRYVLKRVSAAWDYFMRATVDRLGREASIWEAGVLDRLPPELGHVYLACARDGDGWAILMRDIGPELILNRGAITHDEHLAILNGLASMHAAFWDAPELTDATIGLCPPAIHYSIISPATARRHAGAPGVMPLAAQQGWENLATILPPDLFDTCLSLTNEPGPLVAALSRYPMTLVHGDARIANIAIEQHGGRPRATLIDWAIAGVNAAALDLIWYLGARTPWLPDDRESAMDTYRDALQRQLGNRFDPAWWQPMLDLSILGGL